MKQNKNLKLILLILIIVLLSIISFGGIFVQNKGLIDNKMPEYLLSRDLKGYRKVRLVVSNATKTISYDAEGNVVDSKNTTVEVARTEEQKVNSDEILTKENFEMAKKIIQKRLDNMNVKDYEIRANYENGDIILDLPENDDTDRVIGNIYMQGKFEIADNDTNEILMSNKDIKKVTSGYGTSTSGTSAILINIEFNKEGKEKFKNITNTYVQGKKTVLTDDGTEKEETVLKQIKLLIDDETLLTTYFDKEVENGIMQLTLSVPTDATADELKEYLTEANSLSSIMDAGKTEAIYTIDQNQFIFSDITKEQISVFVVCLIVLVVTGIIYLAIKYKEKGILAGISVIGYAALLLIVLRYTNVEISIGGLVILAICLALDYINVFFMTKETDVKEVIKRFTLMYLPVLIISVVFTLMSVTFGAVLFWGVVTILLYNLAVTKTLLK